MKPIYTLCVIITLTIHSKAIALTNPKGKLMESKGIYTLPKPKLTGSISLEKALNDRRSVRSYSNKPLTLEEVSQILWAAQGISKYPEYRTTPSAGAIYPFEIFLAVKNVQNLSPGVYKYEIGKHKLKKLIAGDISKQLSDGALGQSPIKNAAITLAFAASFPKITSKYGERGIRYSYIEAGHISQNVYLETQVLGLGTVAIGAFYDEQVSKVLNLPKELSPIYIMPIGGKK